MKQKTLLFMLSLFVFGFVAQAQQFEDYKFFYGDQDNRPRGTAVDSEGNVYIAGAIKNEHNYGTASNPLIFTPLQSSAYSGYVAKYSKDFELLWFKGYTTATSAFDIHELAVDRQDNLLLAAGYKGDLVTYPAGEIVASSNEDLGSAFFAKYDKDGGLVWYKSLGNLSSGRFHAISSDYDLNVYVSTCFRGSIDLSPEVSLEAQDEGRYSAFVAKYTDAGNFVWAKPIYPDANKDINIKELKVAPSGDVYVSGLFSGNLIKFADIDPVSSNGSGDEAFIAKLSASGASLWVRTIGGDQAEDIRDMAVGEDNSVYAIGCSKSNLLYVSKPGENNYEELTLGLSKVVNIAVLIKLDAEGNLIFHRTWGDGSNDSNGNAIYVDKHGIIWVGGFASGAVKGSIAGANFDLVNRAQGDAVLFKYTPEGELIFARRVGSNKGDQIEYNGIVVDPVNDKLYLAYVTNFTDNFYAGLRYGVQEELITKTGVQKYTTIFTRYDLMEINAPMKLTIPANAYYSNTIGVDGASGSLVRKKVYGTLPAGLFYELGSTHSDTFTLYGTPTEEGVFDIYFYGEDMVGDEAFGYQALHRLQLQVGVNSSVEDINVQAPYLAQSIVTNNQLFINNLKTAVVAKITGADGKVILTDRTEGGISVASLVPGMYIVSIQSTEGLPVTTLKFIKK